MKTKLTLPVCALALASLLAVSCGQKSGRKTSEKAVVDTSAAASDSIVIMMDLSSGYAMAGVRKDSAQTVWVTFNSPGNESLYGKITLPEGVGNVRFNQIIMPDGNMDGPFGRDLTYGLAAKGDYTLAIGESLMEGEPYAGELTVELFTGLAVPYKKVSNYFVRNDVEDSELIAIKIASKREFENFFGGAATMQSRPETIDFSKQYLVAIIGKVTDTATEFEIESALLKDGMLTVVYRQMFGEKQTYTIRPFTLLSIDLQYDGALRVIKAY